MVFSQADAIWMGVLDPRNMAHVGDVGEGFNTEILAAVPSAVSLEPHNPVSLHMTFSCSALPLLEPRTYSWPDIPFSKSYTFFQW